MELKGKKIAFLGDSITEGVGVSSPDRIYHNVLCHKCELSDIFVDGIQGTRIAYRFHPDHDARWQMFFCGRAHFLPADADIVVVYGGVNDYLSGDAPFGEEGDKTFTTFCGAVWYLMYILRLRFGNKPVVFMTPAHCTYLGISDSDTKARWQNIEDRQMPLAEYVKVIEKTAKSFGIHTLNLYENLGIDPNIPDHKERYTVDGLHFNDDGHKVIAERLEEFLRSIDE